jgi:hypothetical protein
MKKKFKKIWNNRIFRTFVETLVATLVGYLTCNSIFDLDSNALISLLVTAIATGLSAIMPLLNEDSED